MASVGEFDWLAAHRGGLRSRQLGANVLHGDALSPLTFEGAATRQCWHYCSVSYATSLWGNLWKPRGVLYRDLLCGIARAHWGSRAGMQWMSQTGTEQGNHGEPSLRSTPLVLLSPWTQWRLHSWVFHITRTVCVTRLCTVVCFTLLTVYPRQERSLLSF